MRNFFRFFKKKALQSKPQTINILNQKEKEKIEIKNLLYKNRKKSEKILQKKRKEFKKHLLSETKKAKKNKKLWTKILKKDKNLKKRLKNFWKNDEKRQQFLKKLGISLGIGLGLTVLCVFYPPATAPLITGLSVVAITSIVKKIFSKSKTVKKSEEVLKNLTNKNQIKEKITQDIQAYIDKKTENINDPQEKKRIKQIFIDKVQAQIFNTEENPDFETKNFTEQKKILEDLQKIQKQIIKNFYQTQKNIFNQLLANLNITEREIKNPNSSKSKNLSTEKEKKHLEQYQELSCFLETHGLIRQVLGEISKPEKFLNHFTSDLALSVYLTISVGLLIFFVKKVPKTPSAQTSGATIIVEDFSKQLAQLFFVSCFGNVLAYPDSWRKAIVDYYNQTENHRFMDPNTYEKSWYQEQKIEKIMDYFVKNLLEKSLNLDEILVNTYQEVKKNIDQDSLSLTSNLSGYSKQLHQQNQQKHPTFDLKVRF